MPSPFSLNRLQPFTLSLSKGCLPASRGARGSFDKLRMKEEEWLRMKVGSDSALPQAFILSLSKDRSPASRSSFDKLRMKAEGWLRMSGSGQLVPIGTH